MKADELLESYPIQFRDKIDEYLWREHHLLGGSCSSVESMKYAVAREVADKLADAFIERACEWIKEKWDDNYTMPIIIDSVIDEFKNYMKG